MIREIAPQSSDGWNKTSGEPSSVESLSRKSKVVKGPELEKINIFYRTGAPFVDL